MLSDGAEVLLRRRVPPGEGQWLVKFPGIVWVRAWDALVDGLRVHAVGEGLVMLESLAQEDDGSRPYLWGNPADPVVQGRPLDPANRTGYVWRVHTGPVNTYRFELVSDQPGPKWLRATPEKWIRLGQPPSSGYAPEHDFVALPAAERQTFAQAELAGDFSFLNGYGIANDGWPAEWPRPTPAAAPVGPTPQTPRLRAGDDPVARELIAALQPCFDDGAGGAENSDYDPDDPRRIGWPHNLVSLDTVASPTGTLYLHGQPPTHRPPPGELDRCRALAHAIVRALGPLRPHGGDHPTPFLPFYLVADAHDPVPTRLSAEWIHAAFNGTLYPDTPITIVPIDAAFVAEHPEWAEFAAWAATQQELTMLSYVAIGYDTGQEPNYAAIFPRLVLGVTAAGSLVGACGTVVQA